MQNAPPLKKNKILAVKCKMQKTTTLAVKCKMHIEIFGGSFSQSTKHTIGN